MVTPSAICHFFHSSTREAQVSNPQNWQYNRARVDIAVGIVNWNSGKALKACLDSLLAAQDTVEIAVVDNASTDDSLNRALGFAGTVQIMCNDSNCGFAGGVNQLMAATHAPFVLILNPDLTVEPGAISRLHRFLASHTRAGAIGGYVGAGYLPRRLPTMLSLMRENLGMRRRNGEPEFADPHLVEQPAASALMIRRSAFDEVGGFDIQFQPAWYEDVDFCRKLKAARWEVYFDPAARFHHEGGYSAKTLGTAAFLTAYYRNQLRYVRKHMSSAALIGVRASVAVGMIARSIVAPGSAGACLTVLAGALGKW